VFENGIKILKAKMGMILICKITFLCDLWSSRSKIVAFLNATYCELWASSRPIYKLFWRYLMADSNQIWIVQNLLKFKQLLAYIFLGLILMKTPGIVSGWTTQQAPHSWRKSWSIMNEYLGPSLLSLLNKSFYQWKHLQILHADFNNSKGLQHLHYHKLITCWTS